MFSFGGEIWVLGFGVWLLFEDVCFDGLYLVLFICIEDVEWIKLEVVWNVFS